MAKIALLIGVSSYKPGLSALPGSLNDVDAMQRVLANSEMGDFTNITVLKNPQPMEMQYAIYKLFTNRHKDDLLLFYFSGHGIKDESGKLYLANCETYKENGRLVKPYAIASNILHESINESKSQRQVIILDCCFSGAIAQGMTLKDDDTIDIQQQLGGKGRAILTSSTSTQYSFEQEDSELSVYTRYLVEGIEKGAADKDGDGWISVDELHEYAFFKVQEVSPAMTPKFYPVEEGHKILLAKSPKDDPKLIYRKEVESRVIKGKGELSIFDEAILNVKRDDLIISVQEAQMIHNEVLQPYQEYQRKLNNFKETLARAINQHYPFSEDDEEAIKEYQKYLELKNEDILLIQEKLLAPVKAELELRQREKEKIIELVKQQSKQVNVEICKQQEQRQVELSKHKEAKFEKQQEELVKREQREFSTSISNYQSSTEIQIKPFDFKFATLIVKTSKRLFGFGTRKEEFEINYKSGKLEYFSQKLGNGLSLEMVSIPGGTFVMGSSEYQGDGNELPQHEVTIKSFFIGKYPVTQAQWAAVAILPKVNIDLNPDSSHFKGNNLPVECITWDDAIEFCDRLSQNNKLTYRLPSEAEWEYACRAGTTTPFCFGETITTDLANFDGNHTYASAPKGRFFERTSSVGSFHANAFGLFDMHGNIWEWCQDAWHVNYEEAPIDGSAWLDNHYNNYRLLRGGSWVSGPFSCRSALRYRQQRNSNNSSVGFRVVCVSI
jgi:formylglycine-generating enzyme required for sulfatase activity